MSIVQYCKSMKTDKTEFLNIVDKHELTSIKLWSDKILSLDNSGEYIENFINFDSFMEKITKKILLASFKRKLKGYPAFDEQDCTEQLEHMVSHLNAWLDNDPDTEENINIEAINTVCRAALALYTYFKEEEIDIIEGNVIV